jgi:hypothetical protein
MQLASDWTLKRFRDYGVDAHWGTIEIPHAYYRGGRYGGDRFPVARHIEVRANGMEQSPLLAGDGGNPMLENES